MAVAAIALGSIALSERARPVPAAMLWGLGIALKLFPLILAPWFLVRRRWTELFGGLLAAAALSLLPVAWVGTEAVRWTLDYFERISAGQAGATHVPDFIHLNVAWMIGQLAGFASTPAWLLLATSVVLMGLAIAADIRRGRDGSLPSAVMDLCSWCYYPEVRDASHGVHHPRGDPAGRPDRTMARLVALALLVLIFNVGFVTPASAIRSC